MKDSCKRQNFGMFESGLLNSIGTVATNGAANPLKLDMLGATGAEVRFVYARYAGRAGLSQPSPPYASHNETGVQSWGEMIDLYDFNRDVPGDAHNAAVVQAGYGNGSYGAGRHRGKIYRIRVNFKKTYGGLP